jgi:hypothetical protein
MGRGIETNLEASMTVDCLNLGMIKHVEVRSALSFELPHRLLHWCLSFRDSERPSNF